MNIVVPSMLCTHLVSALSSTTLFAHLDSNPGENNGFHGIRKLILLAAIFFLLGQNWLREKSIGNSIETKFMRYEIIFGKVLSFTHKYSPTLANKLFAESTIFEFYYGKYLMAKHTFQLGMGFIVFGR